MKNQGEYIVKGDQAKKMIDELKRQPTKAEIERLKKAMKNRVGSKRKGSSN